jgi:N-acetylglucosamine kinase-like BadF-type ATPase
MSGYYIAIDGGSTRSTGLLGQEDLRVLHRASAGCANYHLVGLEGAEKTLLTLIESLCSAGGVSSKEIEGFCFALSGVSRPRDVGSIEEMLRRHLLHKKSKIISDAEAALLGGTSKEAGLAVISGTGSVVFGRNKSGKTKKIGGHGHLIGDPGSGFDIGIRALRAIIAATEGRGEKTKLSRSVLNAPPLAGLKGEDEIVPWIYSLDDPKVTIARLASTVIATSEARDAVAEEILRSAAEELAGLALFAARDLGLTEERFDVVLTGGVFLNNTAYFHLMQSILSETMPFANPMRPENDPAFGALVALLGRPATSQSDDAEDHSGTQNDSGSAS